MYIPDMGMLQIQEFTRALVSGDRNLATNTSAYQIETIKLKRFLCIFLRSGITPLYYISV